MDNAINIVFICDEGYILPTSVAITSIIANKKRNTYLNINIIAREISNDSRDKLRSFIGENVNINIIDVNDTLNIKLNNNNLLSNIPANSSALLKFSIQELLPEIEKVLYLDGDIIVKDDLSILFGWDISRVYCAAVKDIGIGIPKELAKLKGNYFNSGVMLLNLKKMREEDVKNKLCKYRATGYNRFMDQDAFSWVFYGKTLFLPIKFNLMYSVYKYDTFEKISDNYRLEGCSNKFELLNKATIVHLCSREKPWKFYVPKFSDLFIEYYKLSPFKDIELELKEIAYKKKDAPETKKLDKTYECSPQKHLKVEKPLLSLVIPVYNAQEYISNCLGSIYCQNIENIEIVIVDNGSADNSIKIVNNFARLDKRIKVFKENTPGAGNARNLGLSKVSAPYVMFLDADDLLCEDFIKDFINFESQIKSDIYLYEYNNFDNTTLELTEIKPFIISDSEGKDFNGIKYANLGWTKAKNRFLKSTAAPWNKIYSCDYLKKLKASFDTFVCTEDRSFYFQTIIPCKNISVINRPIIYHRKNNPSSLTGDFRLSNFECNFKAHYSIMNKVGYVQDDSKAVLCELTLSDIISAFYLAYGDYKEKIFKQIIQFFSNANFEKYESYLQNSYWYKKYKFYKSLAWIINEDRKIIPVVFSVDNNYVPYLAVAIQSIKNVASSDKLYFIAVLNTDLSEQNITRVEGLSNSNFKIQCYSINGIVNTRRFYNRSHYSIAMYYRLLIAEMFTCFKNVLYLDCDLIVKKNIDSLLDLNLQDNIIAATRNPVQYHNLRYVEYTLQIPSAKYFNSGVIVIDTYNFLREKVKDKCFELLSNYRTLQCPDQDLLNMACYGKVLYLPLEWNFQWHQGMEVKPELKLHEDEYDSYYAASKKYNILHFTSGNKPWIKPQLPLSYEFWRIARLTDFYEEIIYKNTLDKMQYQLRKQINSAGQPILYSNEVSLSRKFFDEIKSNGLLSALKKAWRKLFKK